jgi:hypothetical protein
MDIMSSARVPTYVYVVWRNDVTAKDTLHEDKLLKLLYFKSNNNGSN